MYKHYRTVALKYVVMHFIKSSGEARAMPSALGLGAFITHQFNALMHRPAMDQSSERMLEALTPHTHLNQQDDLSRVCSIGYGYGSLFLNDLVLTDVIWRTPTIRLVPPIDLAYLYRSASIRAVQGCFLQSNTLLERRSQIGRIQNKIRRVEDITILRDNEDDIPDHDRHLPSFNFHEKGIRMKDRIKPSGPDVNSMVVETEFIADSDPYEPSNVDASVDRILRNFPANIFLRGPNKKNNQAGSHIILPRDSALHANISIFKSFDLSNIFYRVQVRFAKDQGVWENQFKYYFPPKGAVLAVRGGLQGFPYLPYYTQWKLLMSQLTSQDAESIRAQIWREFKDLKWLPHATSDKLWNTKQMKERDFETYWCRLPDANVKVACPQIIINPNHPKSNTILGIKLGKEPDFAAQAADNEDEEDEAPHALPYDYDDEDDRMVYEHGPEQERADDEMEVEMDLEDEEEEDDMELWQ